MKINEWFKPHDREHLAAYEQLCDSGSWPKGFIPQTIEMPEGWRGLIADKIASAWLEEKLPIQVEAISKDLTKAKAEKIFEAIKAAGFRVPFYLKVREGKIDHSFEIAEGVVVDLTQNDQVCGLEFHG